MTDFINVLKEVFTGTGDGKKVNEVATPPSDTTGFTEVLKSVFSIDTARTLTEEVLPGTSDVVSAKRTVDSLGEAGAAIRRGDVTGALKGYADATTNAVGALPMVPAIGGILTGSRGRAKGIFDIPDKKTYFKKDLSFFDGTGERKLEEVYNNTELFKLYPELRDFPVVVDSKMFQGKSKKAAGLYQPERKRILMNPEAGKYNTSDTFIHELQHAVDHIENPKAFDNYKSTDGSKDTYQAYYEQPVEKRARLSQEVYKAETSLGQSRVLPPGVLPDYLEKQFMNPPIQFETLTGILDKARKVDNTEIKLSEVLNDPTLFKYRPELNDIKIKFIKGGEGELEDVVDTINKNEIVIDPTGYGEAGLMQEIARSVKIKLEDIFFENMKKIMETK